MTKKGMRYLVAILLCAPVLLAAQEAAAPVPVENEPLHKVVLKNDSVVVIHLVLPAGQRTLYHTHTHDRVALSLSNTSITQQVWDQKEGPSSPTQAGGFGALTLEGKAYTHRVHNVGDVAYDVIDVELQQRPVNPSATAAATVASENPSARIYNWVLKPGSPSAMHTHTRPYLIVAMNGFQLKMTGQDGQSTTHEVKKGDFHWVDAKVTHTLENAGSGEGQIVEVELK